jgi:hypothetical protein
MPVPGQTHAVATLQRILSKYGEGHLRLVLTTLVETQGAALGGIGTGNIETSQKLDCVINHLTAGSDMPGIAQTHVCR